MNPAVTTRTLTTVGAFRVVPATNLRDKFNQPLDPRQGELWHLRDSGLVQTVRLDRDTTVVTLTKEGRDWDTDMISVANGVRRSTMLISAADGLPTATACGSLRTVRRDRRRLLRPALRASQCTTLNDRDRTWKSTSGVLTHRRRT